MTDSDDVSDDVLAEAVYSYSQQCDTDAQLRRWRLKYALRKKECDAAIFARLRNKTPCAHAKQNFIDALANTEAARRNLLQHGDMKHYYEYIDRKQVEVLVLSLYWMADPVEAEKMACAQCFIRKGGVSLCRMFGKNPCPK